VFGSDLDIRVIKGYGVGRKTINKIEGLDKIDRFDILANFQHYRLPRPEFWVQDVHKPMIRMREVKFDAVVCDPPYGVRAMTQKVGVSDKKQ
jgi:tRNA G10  N-methylase Trm11